MNQKYSAIMGSPKIHKHQCVHSPQAQPNINAAMNTSATWALPNGAVLRASESTAFFNVKVVVASVGADDSVTVRVVVVVVVLVSVTRTTVGSDMLVTTMP